MCIRTGGLMFLAVLPQALFAQGTGGTGIGGTGGTGIGPCEAGKICNPLKSPSLQQFAADVLQVLVSIGSVVAVFFLIYAGFLFVSAQGNEEKIKKAKNTFLWTVVGIALLLGAEVLTAVISGTVSRLRS